MIRTVIFIFKSLAFKNEERKKHKANELTLNPVALKGIEATNICNKEMPRGESLKTRKQLLPSYNKESFRIGHY